MKRLAGKWWCDECREYKPGVVEIGESPDHESATAYICCQCLRKAIVLSERKKDKKGK